MEYRMKDIMEPPKTLEEQKKEAREAAMAAGLLGFVAEGYTVSV